ncbi:MAG: biosynthetic-type acetolactate synthase large subunit, partial [Propionibacteriaceae bacterium]|nr:biosynthetic-type acetolactate synthase large subunit [Propionibacteriaceae bacterium]
VAITGQVGSTAIGTDAFQEADIRGITFPITKHNFLIKRADDIAQGVAEAFHIASTGRPGPVLIDVTKDALNGTTEFTWPVPIDLPGYRPTVTPHTRQVKEAASLIAQATRPVILAGGGVIKAGAGPILTQIVEQTGIPVVETLMAQGAVPDSNPLNYGMPGMHGTVAAVGALQRCDLLIALGARFDDRVTGQLSTFAPDATVIHCDIDPAEISKNRLADLPIVGDCRLTLEELAARLAELDLPKWTDWVTYLDGLRQRYPVWAGDPEDNVIQPQEVIRRLSQVAGPDAIFVTGVGQHQMWAAHFVDHERPGQWLTSGGAGTMGYCVPAAMGAKAGQPDRLVWGIDGDGCFQMTNQELVTCVINQIPIKIAIINNQVLGMVRQWQTLFYDERYSGTDLYTNRVPDFVKLAEAMGCAAFRAVRPDEVNGVIAQAMEINDRPVVVEFVVSKDAMVWPMVPAGTSNDDIRIAKDLAPQWEDDDL